VIVRILAILAGVVFGIAAISSASWIWLKKTNLTLQKEESLEQQLHDLTQKNDQLSTQLTAMAELFSIANPEINKKLDLLVANQHQLQQQMANVITANERIVTPPAAITSAPAEAVRPRATAPRRP
jgi:hypothetical protein